MPNPRTNSVTPSAGGVNAGPAAIKNVPENLTYGCSDVLFSFMTEPAGSDAERVQRILGELTELGLALARDLHARALAAETAQEAQALGLAFQRVSRSVRQSLALEAKLQRDAKLAAREAQAGAVEDRAPARQPWERRVTVHQDRVREAMHHLLWTEAEGDEGEFEILEDDLTVRLEEAAFDGDAFLQTPVEALVARFAAEMELRAPARVARPNGHAAHNSS
jgi:hypothetical protein